MMEYREVYFRIRSSYRYDSGWPDKGVEHAFRDETRTLFQSAGWELHPARERQQFQRHSHEGSAGSVSPPHEFQRGDPDR